MKQILAIALLFFALNLSAQVLRDTTPLAIEVATTPGDPGHIVTGPMSGLQYRAATGTFTTKSNMLSDTVYLVDDNPKAPSIYQLVRMPLKEEPKHKYLFVFKKQKAAQVVSEIAGYGFIALGAYLSGKAEYYSRYHGTTSDYDTYHVTRDAGLVSTGLGCTMVGFGLGTDDKLEPWEIGIKAFGMLLGYRSIAEATYNSMKK